MSAAKPMSAERRREVYLAQTGRTELTPAQARQVARKERLAARDLPRTGRMRKRFERVHQRRVRDQARAFMARFRGGAR